VTELLASIAGQVIVAALVAVITTLIRRALGAA